MGKQVFFGSLVRSEIDKYKYNKEVYVAAIGNCHGCFYCVNACSESAIEEVKPPVIDYGKCTRCMECIKACPKGVMQLID